MNSSYYTQVEKLWHKVKYFVSNGAAYAVPNALYRLRRKNVLNGLSAEEREYVEIRAHYYNKLKKAKDVGEGAIAVGDYHFPMQRKHRFSTYFFDIYKVLRYFPVECKFHTEFGDVTEVPAVPTFVKSRPVHGDVENAVVLNMDSVRHFYIPKDHTPYEKKKDMLIFRNACTQPHRLLFLEKHHDNPLVDARSINDIPEHPEWKGDYITIQQQMQYKFIACIEGNDVATNLKWTMASNSIAVMPDPHYETWFMEGILKPDYHYISVKDDYSDLTDKLQYYLAHPDEAGKIREHAHEYIRQFYNKKLELATSLRVAELYFENCK